MNAAATARVSIHGGHSGEFCGHAADTLEAIVVAYIERGFSWVGLTEHMPPDDDALIYPEEASDGYTSAALLDRFARYIAVARSLQERYRSEVDIAVGFETEYYTRYGAHLRALLDRFSPDYIVGSVHHVNDIPIDFDLPSYDRAMEACGGKPGLYCAYFDQQYELIDTFSPAVVGHFDLIRLWDASYADTIRNPDVWERIVRNLELIADRRLILDYNVRAFEKGSSEPYVSGPILALAHDLGIAVVPGDDSHGVAGAGLHIEKGVALLVRAGFSLDWRLPGLRR